MNDDTCALELPTRRGLHTPAGEPTTAELVARVRAARASRIPIVAASARACWPDETDPQVDAAADLVARLATLALSVGAERIEAMFYRAMREVGVRDQPAREIERMATPGEVFSASPDGWIYYARVQGHIKIGWTSQTVQQRMKGYPPGSELLACHPGSRARESQIHASLSMHLVAGKEWFVESPEVMSRIDAVVAEHGPAPALPAPAPWIKPEWKPKFDYRPMRGISWLMSNGWTRGMIDDFLGAPDSTEGHIFHQRYGSNMKLYLVERVEAAEETPEFKKRQARRAARSA